MSNSTILKYIPRRVKWKNRPKWIRISVRVVVTIIALWLGIFAAANIYVFANKEELLSKIKATVANEMDGNFDVKDIDVALGQTFPNISVRLSGITVSDTLYYKHKRNLLELKELFVTLDPVSLIKLKPQLGRITLKNGKVFMFKDADDYTNTYILNGKPKPDSLKKEGGMKLDILKFKLIGISYVFDNPAHDKKIDIYVNRIKGAVTFGADDIWVHTNLRVHIHQLGFDLEKGAFAQNTRVRSDLNLVFHKKTQQIAVDKQPIRVNNTHLIVSARFNLKYEERTYDLVFDTKKVDFQEGRSFLSNHIQEKLDIVDIKHPLAVRAHVAGRLTNPDLPLVELEYSAERADISFKIGRLLKTKFSGIFTNNRIVGKPYDDENMMIFIDKMHTMFEGDIPVTLDSSYAFDFTDPMLYCKAVSTFPVEQLDAMAGKSFNLSKGTASINLTYLGALSTDDIRSRLINGEVKIKNAAMEYLPRNLFFDKCDATLHFVGQDLFFKEVSLHSANSSLQMEGQALHFLSAYFNDQHKANFDFKLSSSKIDLYEFKGFLVTRGSQDSAALAERKRHKKMTRKETFTKVNNQIDRVLAQSNMFINVQVDEVVYKTFEATNIHAKLSLLDTGMALQDVLIHHADGKIALDASVNQADSKHPFSVDARISTVDISKLFKGFDNFGMASMKSSNISGIFSANVDVVGTITENGRIKANSLNGNIDFDLTDGALSDFKPLMEIQKYVFKKRHLEHLSLEPLKHQFLLKDGMVYITPMEIVTSALYMKLQGVYGIKKGTDLFLEIPLRNPEKDRNLIAKGKAPKRNSGLVIFLRAQDDDQGRLHIGWDPQKEGLSEVEQKLAEEH